MAKSYIASRKAIQLKMSKLFQKQPYFAESLSQSAVAGCCFDESLFARSLFFILLKNRHAKSSHKISPCRVDSGICPIKTAVGGWPSAMLASDIGLRLEKEIS